MEELSINPVDVTRLSEEHKHFLAECFHIISEVRRVGRQLEAERKVAT